MAARLLEQGCQTHSVLQARLYISGPQTFLSADTGNQLIKFRGTPATLIYSH